MGRREAVGIFHRKPGEMKRAPKITQAMMQQKVRQANVTLRGAGVGESPHCYKRLLEVLAAHEATIRILHPLTPVGVATAGADEFNPYKDKPSQAGNLQISCL
jgi:tRNA-splicing ligase RtcB